MSRTITIINLILCVVLLCNSRATQALVVAPQEPENCFVFKLAPRALTPSIHSLPLVSNSTVSNSTPSYISSPEPTREQVIVTASDLQTTGAQNTLFMSLLNWFEPLEVPTLPIPASLVFVILWLIGFKMTRQPTPMLSRAAPQPHG